MDPNQAWFEISQAVAENQWHDAVETAENLIEWLAVHGFPPTITGITEFDRIIARATCDAIACRAVA